MAVIEHVWMGFDTPYEPDPRYDELTSGQRSLYALLWVQAEVDNGGFSQFFWNSTGFFAPDLPDAARQIGLERHVELFLRANGMFPEGVVPRDRGEREREFDAALARLGDDAAEALLGELDDAFYELEKEFDRSLERYIETHPDEFFR